jgi:myo-inositol-1(or 4)-monophosphatase
MLEYIIDLAFDAGALILKGFNELKTVTEKSSVADIVTEFDVAVENLLKDSILKKFPDHEFLAEESAADGQVLTDKPTWIIDPIDGTANFVGGFPCFCVSIGFAVNKEVLYGIIYNPLTDEIFYAEKGQGAFLERRKSGTKEKLDISARKGRMRLSDSLISIGFGVPIIRANTTDSEVVKFQELILENTRRLQRSCREIRRIGSAALDLCYVAAGRTDAYSEFGVKEWDVAAGLLILNESGGIITQVNGQKFDMAGRNILACCNPDLAAELSSILLQWENFQ